MIVYLKEFFEKSILKKKSEDNNKSMKIYPACRVNSSKQKSGHNPEGIPLECQTDWIQIRPDVLSGLVWVLTVCKGYQQMTLVSKELSSKNFHIIK